MTDTIITAEGLSKSYIIDHQRQEQGLRHAIESAVRAPINWVRSGMGARRARTEEFWALRDVNLKVQQGEVIGIIGRNGAGKSTLLKVLSRITEPTKGRVTIKGRVASLLEVGTGFHQELTGRENIFLNGAILGMTHAEIRRKFDEIVAFAEVERFLDTPVKRYSSGMYVRLAFAVAAHLEPEILVIDEVLAVGDASFQKKSLGKMSEVAHGGRTVLFVSHNMAAVQALCSSAMLLTSGQVAAVGSTTDVIAEYMKSFTRLQERTIEDRKDRKGGDRFRFTNIEFMDPETLVGLPALISGQPVLIRIHFRNLSSDVLGNVSVVIFFYTSTGTLLCGCRSRAVGVTLKVAPGAGHTDCLLRRLPLKGGLYSFALYAEDGGDLDDLPDAGTITVEDGDYYGSGFLPARGLSGVLVDYEWRSDASQYQNDGREFASQRNRDVIGARYRQG
jgi:lipopolysaccharide transport system ATP-binding protein